MNCDAMIDKMYGTLGERPLSLTIRLRLALHVIFCPQCAERILRLEAVQDIMAADFFPPSPVLEDLIMDRIYDTGMELPDLLSTEPIMTVPFQGWVVTGLVILVALATSVFGMDFINLAKTSGTSFLLPVGLVIGGVITSYGALFIGSHLKELSDRFNLHD
jgi:hypothetical protein